MADLKLDGLTVASSSGSPTVVNIDSDVASRITAKGIAKAWVVFNGQATDSSFTLANGGILAAFNVSSVTNHGDGEHTVVFENAMDSANYTISLSNNRGGSIYHAGINPEVITASSFKIFSYYPDNATKYDPPYVSATIFGS